MTLNVQIFLRWLADYQLLALLLVALAALGAIVVRQPARRIALAKASLAALAALAALCAVPGWSAFHLAATHFAGSGRSTPRALDAAPRDLSAGQSIPTVNVDRVPAALASGGPSPPATPLAPPRVVLSLEQRVALALGGAYVAGSALVLLWLAGGGLYARRLRTTARPAAADWQSLLRQLSGRLPHPPELLVSEKIETPVALGVRHPAIVIPLPLKGRNGRGSGDGPTDGAAQFSAPGAIEVESPLPGCSLRSILAHELAHIRHGDLQTLAASRALLVLLWPQPLFWRLRRTLRVDQEVLADAAAAELTSRVDYAEQLVAWAKQNSTCSSDSGRSQLRRVFAATTHAMGLWENTGELRRRIATLLDERLTLLRAASRRWQWTCGLAGLTTAVALSFVTTEPASHAAPAASSRQVAATDAQPRDGGAPAVASNANEKPASAGTTDADARIRQFLRETKPEPNVLAGVCIDEAGKPLAGVEASLYLYVMDLGTSDAKQTRRLATQTTGVDGKYRFQPAIDVNQEYPKGLPAEHFQVAPAKVTALVARAPGRTSVWGSDIATSVVRRGDVRVMNLPPAAVLRGRVADQEGQPVADALVTVGMDAGIVVAIPGVPFHSARTDAEGRYAIDDVSVYDEETARKKLAAWAEGARLKAGATGEFRAVATAVSADPYAFKPKLILVQHPDFAAQRVAITQIPGDVDATLQSGAVITGRVVYREGDELRPAAGIRVNLQRYSDKPSATERSPDAQVYEVRSEMTDRQGNYRIASLLQGTYNVGADAGEEWVTTGVDSVSCESGQTTPAPDVVLTHGGVVRAQLVDAGTGKPLTLPGGGKGWLNATPAPRRNTQPLDVRSSIVTFSEQGVAERHVAPGKYYLFASIPDDEGMARLASAEHGKPLDQWPTYEIAEGQTLDVTLPMQEDKHPARAVSSTSRG